jgi:RNA polymerase sigma-70 factor (ECF subfamily)
MTDIEEIYREYFKDVYAYILRLSGDEHVAEDITGETFFKAIKAIDKFRGDCHIRVWLCQIAKNCYYSYLKKTRNISTESLDYPEISLSVESAEDSFLRKDEISKVREILKEIPETYREVFVWRITSQLSFREIGEIFGKTDHWACVTFHRARKMIEEGLQRYGYEK